MKLTPEQKTAKDKADKLLKLCNTVTTMLSFGKIKTYGDLYAFIGAPDGATNSQSPITKPEVVAALNLLKNPVVSVNVPVVTTVTPAHIPLPPATMPEVHVPPALEVDNADNDYGLVPSPNEDAFLYWFQKKGIKELYDSLIIKKNTAAMLLAGTGVGKTFIAGGIIRRMLDANFHIGKTFGFVHYLVITKSSVVEKTDRDFKQFRLSIKDGVEVLNVEQLRARAGEKWVDLIPYMEDGVEKTKWVWKPMLHPCVVIWDECQVLKNEGSIQHDIATALNDATNVTQIFMSATPFTKVSEAKCFAVATKKDISSVLGTPNRTIITNSNWPTYAANICKGTKPTEHNEAAVERLVNDLDPYIVRVRGVRPQFDAINSVKLINFKTSEEYKEYDDAWKKYQEEKKKIRDAAIAMGKDPEEESEFQILVKFLKFRMAAEKVRRRYIAEWLLAQVNDGFAAVAALNFKGTIIEIIKILVDEYGIPRHKISIVWGGGQTAMTKKQKAKRDILEKADELKALGMCSDDLLKTLNLTDVDDRVLENLPKHLELGAQSKDQRQKEIDRFQSGKSNICIFTFRAGGVGLSLHHTDEQCKVKVRRKKSGYAYEEDIKNIPIRPRKAIVAPTYSAIELVQGLGRCPRLTSLSNTEQELVYYRGTIEEDVAAVTSNKLRCLSKVVRQRESWADVITSGKAAKDHIDDTVTEEKGTNYDDLNNSDEEDDEV